LYYVQASSDTLGDAFRRVVRYCSIQNEGVAIAYGCGNSASIRFEYRGVRRLNDRHQVEFFVAAVVRLWRQLTGRHLIPNCVKMAHRRVEVHPEVRTFFGCNVLFGGDIDSIEFPASVALLPLVAADEYLNGLLVKYCDETLSKRRLVAKSWRLAVENALAPLLPHGQGTVSEVSNRLAVSERTLARRLAEEGATFHDVLDNLRFELAKRYLEEPQFPVTEIAWLLGYGNPTAFTHAFRRWTGRPPSKYPSYHNCAAG
jgi:AraC-like DNA-binding protein